MFTEFLISPRHGWSRILSLEPGPEVPGSRLSRICGTLGCAEGASMVRRAPFSLSRIPAPLKHSMKLSCVCECSPCGAQEARGLSLSQWPWHAAKSLFGVWGPDRAWPSCHCHVPWPLQLISLMPVASLAGPVLPHRTPEPAEGNQFQKPIKNVAYSAKWKVHNWDWLRKRPTKSM